MRPAESPSRPGVHALQRKAQPGFGKKLLLRVERWVRDARRRLATRQPAPNTPKKRRRVRWIVAIVLLLLAYPVLGTVALWTGLVERLLKSEDLRVEIQNPSYTIWPGRVFAKHVRILANGTTQFILEGHELVLDASIFPLFQRRVHVTKLGARDVTYQMRVQVKDTKGIERRVAAYPPLRDLPGVGVIREKTAQKTEETEADWTVQVEGLDIAVKELWFFEYRYLGKGFLRGAFLVGPNVMEVRTAVQDVGPGELRFGPDHVVAKNLRGQITADIPRLNPKERADASFMELVTARVNLKSDVQSLENLGAYAPGLEVSRGAGPLALDLYLDRGRLGVKSRLDYTTEAVGVKGHGFGVGSDLTLAFDAAGSPERLPIVRNASKATYLSLARGMRTWTIQILGHREEAKLDTIQLSRATDLKSASVRMPAIRSVDLEDLPGLLPDGTPVAVKSGDLEGSLSLDMDKDFWARGPLKLGIRDLVLDASGIDIGTNLALDTELRVNPKRAEYHVENLLFTVRDAGVRAGDTTMNGWWMNLASKRLSYHASEPPRFDGTLSVRARDLEPVLESLAEREVISKLIPFFTSLYDFRASARIESAGPVTDVTLASESEIWDVAGRVYQQGERSQFALVFGGQAVSLGLAKKHDEGLEIMPFAKTTWLNDRLREFPKPLRMRGKKP
jgi:hypothetical protein